MLLTRGVEADMNVGNPVEHLLQRFAPDPRDAAVVVGGVTLGRSCAVVGLYNHVDGSGIARRVFPDAGDRFAFADVEGVHCDRRTDFGVS